MDINEYSANKLKELRHKKNLTQQELAEELNITQQQINRYENNQRKFKQNFLFKLADYFNVSVDYFFPEKIYISELELLFDKNKDILTKEDEEYIKFIIEKRKKEIDKELGKE